MRKLLLLALLSAVHLFGTTSPVNPVPEPSTLLLTAGGLVGAIWLLRRKRK